MAALLSSGGTVPGPEDCFVTQYSQLVAAGHRPGDTGLMKYLALAAAIVAIAIGLRWALLSTYRRRFRRQYPGAGNAAARRSLRARLMALAAWPVFFVLVAVVVTLGLIAGMLVGSH